VAKENAIATLGVLYGDFETVLPTLLTGPAALALLVVQMLFVPCVATVAAMRQESGSWMVLSLVGGILVYQVGTLIVGG